MKCIWFISVDNIESVIKADHVESDIDGVLNLCKKRPDPLSPHQDDSEPLDMTGKKTETNVELNKTDDLKIDKEEEAIEAKTNMEMDENVEKPEDEKRENEDELQKDEVEPEGGISEVRNDTEMEGHAEVEDDAEVKVETAVSDAEERMDVEVKGEDEVQGEAEVKGEAEDKGEAEVKEEADDKPTMKLEDGDIKCEDADVKPVVVKSERHKVKAELEEGEVDRDSMDMMIKLEKENMKVSMMKKEMKAMIGADVDTEEEMEGAGGYHLRRSLYNVSVNLYFCWSRQ